jgi:hypothetical protein
VGSASAYVAFLNHDLMPESVGAYIVFALIGGAVYCIFELVLFIVLPDRRDVGENSADNVKTLSVPNKPVQTDAAKRRG